MRSSRRSVAGLLAVVAFVSVLVSCTDKQTAPTEAATALGRRTGASLTGCLSLTQLTSLVSTVFGSANMPNQNSALSKLNQITKALDKGDVAGAQDAARNLISFIRLKATALAVQSQAQTLINAIECYAGLNQDTWLVMPADLPQNIFSSNGQAGIHLPANPVSTPTLITITMLDPNGTAPLITKLDKYPGYVEISQQSDSLNALVGPVTVAVCPVAGIPDSIASRLRLGHQSAVHGFEVTPPGDASFLNCTGIASAESKMPGWVRTLASLVMPKPLYARMRYSGGVGGTAEEFSPFGPVDPMLSFTGGVGGTAEEFIKEQPAPKGGTPSGAEGAVKARRQNSTETALSLVTYCDAAEVGTAIPANCRPTVTLRTVQGTPFINVPVDFAVGQSGGLVARDNAAGAASDCSTFGATAASATNTNGNARACWTLGDTAAVYTVTATPHLGGDAIAGVTFSQPSITFTATATKSNATLTLGNTTQVYDGSAKSVTVTTAPVASLAVVNITYNGSPTAPTEAGSYAVVATLVNPSFQGTASGTLTISKATQAALSIKALTAPAVYGSTIPLETEGGSGAGAVTFTATGSCSASGSTLTITSGIGTCSIAATKSGGNNYNDASATLDVATIKAAATLTLGNLSTTYSGAPNVATVTTSPVAGLGAISITYDGSTSAPVNAGSYAVAATLSNDNYTGSAAGTMVVAKAPASVSLGALTATYDGTPKSVTIATSPASVAASVAVTYNGSPSAPTNAGSYSVLATVNNANYTGSAAATLVINPAVPTITWANPANITLGTPLGAAQLNATASTTGSFAYTPPAGTVLTAGTNTLSTLFTPSTANFTTKSATVSINVRYVQVGCFASPVYNVMPDTKSYQRKGSNLPIKCTLTNAQGQGVMNATGNLLVEDLGVNGSTPTGTPLSVTNAFKVSNSGNYAYGLDTSPASFISTHYYRVTASWNDGSTTVGWFYIR